MAGIRPRKQSRIVDADPQTGAARCRLPHADDRFRAGTVRAVRLPCAPDFAFRSLIGRERAAVAVAVLTAMAVVGRMLLSMAADRLDQRLACALSFPSQAAALCVVIDLDNDYVLIAVGAVFGFSAGNLMTLTSPIVQEFDSRSFWLADQPEHSDQPSPPMRSTQASSASCAISPAATPPFCVCIAPEFGADRDARPREAICLATKIDADGATATLSAPDAAAGMRRRNCGHSM